jgi:hypothetical protein
MCCVVCVLCHVQLYVCLTYPSLYCACICAILSTIVDVTYLSRRFTVYQGAIKFFIKFSSCLSRFIRFDSGGNLSARSENTLVQNIPHSDSIYLKSCNSKYYLFLFSATSISSFRIRHSTCPVCFINIRLLKSRMV